MEYYTMVKKNVQLLYQKDESPKHKYYKIAKDLYLKV